MVEVVLVVVGVEVVVEEEMVEVVELAANDSGTTGLGQVVSFKLSGQNSLILL